MRETENNLNKLCHECRAHVDKFLEKYSENKKELGQIVSWLSDTYSCDELISILWNSVEKRIWEITSIDKSLIVIKKRLVNRFNKPEYYLNDHVISLVSVLNSYDDYI